MNVFVLCTGRSGSTTFIRACQHITNYSAAHESRVDGLGEARLSFPENHIEADNRLSWLLGRLDARYGDDAYYLHLTRDHSAIVRSYSTRLFRGGIMLAYRNGILMKVANEVRDEDIAHDYYETVNANINAFLKDKKNVMHLDIDHAKDKFTTFWKWVGASGDLDSALKEFDKKYNRTPDASSRPAWLTRAVNKLIRILNDLPEFIRRS